MTGAGASGNLALERKITDGLNLVHGEIAVLREEVRENRREARADCQEIRADLARLGARIEESADTLRQEMAAGFTAVRQEMAAQRQESAARFGTLEKVVRELAAMTARSQERNAWIRRLAWGLGTLFLLVIGALAGPLDARAVAALFGG